MVNQWDIYLCDLSPVQGSEQRGTRPVIVLSNNAVNHALPVSTIAPFSTLREGTNVYPTEIAIPAAVSGLDRNSIVMIQQLRTVSHARFIRKLSRLEDEGYRRAIQSALQEYFEPIE